MQSAQNQHFVPRLILRNFALEGSNARVAVFSKSRASGFETSIKNIMAERRFHDFQIGDGLIATYEDATSKVESILAPAYQEVIETRAIPQDSVRLGALITLVAFQFLRTRAFRDQFLHLRDEVARLIEVRGGVPSEVPGLAEFEENDLKRMHLSFLRENLQTFALMLSDKVFFLMEPSAGRSFYLGDAPVCLHNSQRRSGPYGNIGFAVPGIEVYLPISHDLCLAAWCPTIVEKMRENTRESERKLNLLSGAFNVLTKSSRSALLAAKALHTRYVDYFESITSKRMVRLTDDNMDFLNALQVRTARDHIICKRRDFALAGRVVADVGAGNGKWFSFG